MNSKRDLKIFLEEISHSAKFSRFDYASPEKFRIELRCQAEKDQTMEYYVEFARNWIRKFSKYTATSWIVRNSFLKLKRLVFRKVYVCNRSAFNKRTKMDNETRNQECKAKIDFKIKKITRNTIKNDYLLKDGLNLNIVIDFVHSHKVRTPESYHLLRNTTETEEVFQKYFDLGCSAAAAKAYHELTLINKYGEDCPHVFENANTNPALRNLIYLQEKFRKKKILRNVTSRELMEEKRESLKDAGIEIVLSEADMETTLIITPLMKRVVTEIGLEYILVDSTDVSNGPTATFILVPTNIGAFPVACILHGKYDLNHGLQLTKSHLETITGQVFHPKVILNDFEDQLNQTLPSTNLLTSHHTICSEIWCWLNDDENKVDRKKRHHIMLLIKSLLKSGSPKIADKLYSELQENENVVSNPKLNEYLKSLWEKKNQWILPEDNHMNNNLVEMSIRFLKEFLARRCKSFNEPLILDVIINILENYYKRVLANYVKKLKTVATCTKFLTKANIVLNFGSDVRRISSNEFRIDLQFKPKRYIFFRTDTMCCDCKYGRKGNFCEHLSAIVNIIDCEVMKPPILTEEEKELYIKIIGGEVEEEIKPEICEDVNTSRDFDDIEKQFDDFNENLDTTNDGAISDASSPRSAGYNDNGNDFYVEVKTERPERFDPLDEQINDMEPDQTNFVTAQNIPSEKPSTSKRPDIKKAYEIALKAMNDEFRRLNRFFSENPNASNLETMTRLARELGKIRPVERVNLDNMILKLNENRKRKREY